MFAQQTKLNEIYSSVGVATIEERIKLESEFEKFLESQHVLGIRTLEKISNMLNETNSNNQFQVFSASGFFIEKNTIATVSHAVKNKKKNEVLFDGKWKKIEFLGRVQTKDIAFFGFDKNKTTDVFKYKSAFGLLSLLSSYQSPVPLEKVLVGMKCVAGDESRIFIGELIGIDVASGLFAFSIAGSAEGCSGAPVFTFDGSIIGISQAGFSMGVRAYALDIIHVLSAHKIFLDQKEQKNK